MSRKRSKLANRSTKNIQHNITSAPRIDAWGNVINNLGTKNSKSGSSTFLPSNKLDKTMLTNMYAGDAIARQIVNIIVDDAMRGFINADDLLLDELKRINAKQKITEAATWGRLYGGAALVAFVDDGQEMERPLKLDRVRKVVSLQVYDRYQISFMQDDINQDFYSEFYGKPEVYTITNSRGGRFKVHRSRMHLFGGQRVPKDDSSMNNGWDDSVLQSLFQSLMNFGQSMNASAEILQGFIQVILGVNGLADMLTQGNEEDILKRMQIIDIMGNVSNTILIDAEHETYSKHASNVGGLTDILEKQQEVLCAGSLYTMTRLFGVTSKGLGNSGNTDSDNLNNTVEAYRCDKIEPCFDWLIDILEVQSDWKDKPESFDWTFPSLKTSNEHEVAKNRLLAAQTDQIYIDRGGVPADFIFKKRYSDGGFQTDIFISEEEMQELEGVSGIDESYNEQNYKDVTELQKLSANKASEQNNLDSVSEYENKKRTIELENLELDRKAKEEFVKMLTEMGNGQ